MRAPFHNRSFRRLFAGRAVTNVGDSLYFVAAMWLVYSLTGDPLYSGAAGFLTLAPSALQFLAGPLVDRWSIRRTLVGTQAVQAVVVAVIPIAAATGHLRVELVLVVMPLLAALNQLVYPAQSAALPRLLDDDDLVAANSAFTVAYQGIDMVANGVGGVLIGVVGAVSLFLVDAVTFAVAAGLFATVAVPPAARGEAEDPSGGSAEGTEAAVTDGGREDTAGTADDRTDGDARSVNEGGDDDTADTSPLDAYLDRLRAGIDFVRGTFLVWLIAGAAVLNFTSGMTLAAMPAYADALGVPAVFAVVGEAGAYGVLMAAFAAGNLGGALGASLVDERPFGMTLIVAFASTGVLWTTGLVVGWLPVTAVLFALAAVPAGVVNVQLSAIVQSAPPEEYVGRVSSVLGSATSVAIPIGALVGGAVAGAVAPVVAMGGLGAAGVLVATYTIAVPGLRGLPSLDEIALDNTDATAV